MGFLWSSLFGSFNPGVFLSLVLQPTLKLLRRKSTEPYGRLQPHTGKLVGCLIANRYELVRGGYFGHASSVTYLSELRASVPALRNLKSYAQNRGILGVGLTGFVRWGW